MFPDGWNFSVGGAGLTFVSAKLTGDTVVLQTADGGFRSYKRASDDPTAGWTPANGGTDLVVVAQGFGVVVVHGADGLMYVFNAYGQIASVQTEHDVATPANVRFSYDDPTGRFRAITDPVTNRSIRLTYTSDSDAASACVAPPSGFDALAAVPGMLCRAYYWDGTYTSYFYNNGKLARIVDPGGVTTDFGYGTKGRVNSIRSPFGADELAFGVVTDPVAVSTLVFYDGLGRVTKVQQPQASARHRPRHRNVRLCNREHDRRARDRQQRAEVVHPPRDVRLAGARPYGLQRSGRRNDHDVGRRQRPGCVGSTTRHRWLRAEVDVDLRRVRSLDRLLRSRTFVVVWPRSTSRVHSREGHTALEHAMGQHVQGIGGAVLEQ